MFDARFLSEPGHASLTIDGGSETFLRGRLDEGVPLMLFKSSVLLAIALLAYFPAQVRAGIALGTAGDFAVLAGSTVTNTGPTSIDGGNVGVSPGSSITGFSPGSLAAPYTFHTNDAMTTQAHNDLTTAFNAAVALAPTQILTGQDLGGMTLTPGVYFFSSTAQLTGILTLNDQGDPNAQFVFQVGSTLSTASDASVVTINGGSTSGSNIFWQVGSSATLGKNTAFEGNILALTSITLTTGATILDGSALAMNGAVTLDSNQITANASVPEPASAALVVLGASLVGLPVLRNRLRP